jgi:hypothetical protein
MSFITDPFWCMISTIIPSHPPVKHREGQHYQRFGPVREEEISIFPSFVHASSIPYTGG